MSMRRHADARAEESTARAMSDARLAANSTTYVLRVDGVPVDPRAVSYEGDDIRSGDTYAFSMSATLAGRWPDTALEGKIAEIIEYVHDPDSDYVAEWPAFEGHIKTVDRTDDGDTEIVAYTPGEILSRQKLGQRVSWSGQSPKSAMNDAVKDAGYRRIDLRDVPDWPPMYRDRDEAFGSTSARTELLEDVRDQAHAVFHDDSYGKSGRGTALSSLKVPTTSSQPNFTYVVGRDIRLKGFKPSTTRDGRYSHVVVLRDEPDGGTKEIVRLPVDNKGIFVPNFVDFEITVTDLSAEALSTAIALAGEAQRALSYGAWSFSADVLIPDPRVIRGTHGMIEEEIVELSDLVLRRWLVVVCQLRRDPKNKETTLSGVAYKILERRTPIATVVRRGPSMGVVMAAA